MNAIEAMRKNQAEFPIDQIAHSLDRVSGMQYRLVCICGSESHCFDKLGNIPGFVECGECGEVYVVSSKNIIWKRNEAKP